LFILDKCFAASREDFKQDVFQGRARPSLGVVHRYIKYNLKKKERRPEPQARSARHTTLRRWVLPVRSWLGSTLAVGFYPFVVGSYPSLLGLTLRCWVLPFVVGSYPSSLVPTIRRWALPFVIGPYHSSLGLRRCVLRPSQLGLPLRFGFTLHCWVLPPEGSGCDHLRVVTHFCCRSRRHRCC